MNVIPFGADYDDDGNRIDAVDAYDRTHGDPETPWPESPVRSVRSVRSAGHARARIEPPFNKSGRSVRTRSVSDTSDTPPHPLTSGNDTSDSPDTGLLDGIRSGDWLSEQTFPPLQFAVPGIVPAGFTLLAGPPKAGKSWLLLDWLIAVVMGGRALGKISAGAPRQVFYLALEDSDRRMQARCSQLLQGHGRLPADVRLPDPMPASSGHRHDPGVPGEIPRHGPRGD